MEETLDLADLNRGPYLVTAAAAFDYLFELFTRNVFVFDLTDNLFENVFHRYKTTHTAVFVDDHRELDVSFLHLFQQIGNGLGFGNEINVAHKRLDALVFAPVGPALQQVADVNDTVNVV